MEKMVFQLDRGALTLFTDKKSKRRAMVAGAMLTVALLGLFVLLGLLRRGNGVSPVPAQHGLLSPAVKPEKGLIIFQSRIEGFWQIYSLDLFSGARTRLTRSAADDITPSVSPDGAWIVFQSSRSGAADVWRMGADGTKVERLTDENFDCFDPCWGGSGSYILYSSRRSGRENIFAMELKNRQERQLTDSFWSSILPSVSFDDSAVVFARSKLGWDIYRMDSDGSNVVALTAKGGNCRPDWSPDGRRIAYVSDVADGKGDVWIMDANGENKKRITPGDESYDYNPAWSPDGRWIIYETATGSKNGPWSLAVIPADGGTPILLTPPGADDRFPDWAPGKAAR